MLNSEELFQTGRDYLDQGKYSPAYEQFQQSVELEPSSDKFWYYLGLACYWLRDYSEAIEHLNQSLQINPNYIPALSTLGSIYSILHQSQAAKVNLEQAILIQPQDVYDWINNGQGLNYLERYEEAIISFDKAIEIQPDYHYAWCGRGVVLYHLERYEEAISSFDNAIKYKPDFYLALKSRGDVLYHLERYEEAISSFDQALELNADDAVVWIYRGYSLFCLKKYEEAISSFDQALELNADDAVVWSHRGYALNHLDRYEKAIISFDRAIEIKPDFYQALEQRGVTLNKLGRYKEAITSFDQAIEYKLDDHYALHNRGYALFKLERYAEAIISLDQAIESKPDFYEALCSKSNLLKVLETYEEAIIFCKQGLENFSKISEDYLKLSQHIGNLYIQQAELELSAYSDYAEKAIQVYEETLEKFKPESFPEIYLEILQSLDMIYIQIGKPEKGLFCLRQGTSIIKSLLTQKNTFSDIKQKSVQQFLRFNQFTVDKLIDRVEIVEALEVAEESKNTCLSWLLSEGKDKINRVCYSDLKEFISHKNKELPSQKTAIVYWHLSPDALTTFVLLPDIPNPILIESAIVPGENDLPSASVLQFYEWKNWLTQWNDSYESYGTSKDKQKKALKGNRTKNPPWRAKMQNRLDSLGQILNIAAIEDYLKNHSIQNLILIPHRDLHRFPLHSFFENYTCTYLPSAYLALQQRHIDFQLSKLLIVENPKSQPHLNGKPQKLDELPFAEVEAALIRQIYTQHTTIEDENDQTQRITCEAVQTALRQSHDIFHFTGHGAYNSQNPAQSCLFLSATEQLTLRDIKDLDLSSYRLVCLAACETAVTGNQTITDEYVGLVSGFLKAGVTYVVSTLWTVESAATMLFMRQFYQNLQAKQLPPTALKNAQTWLKEATREDLVNFIQGAMTQLSEQKALQLALEDEQFRIRQIKENKPYSHPYYWAAFTISGLYQ